MKLALACVLMLIPGTSAANAAGSNSVANSLGSMLASEEICGLSYRQDAIVAYIERNVPADDMGFASKLKVYTDGNRLMIERMSSSERTAHCAQIKRAARKNGLIY